MPAARQTDVSVVQLADWIVEGRNDFLLIDVRDAAEFAAYHPPARAMCRWPSSTSDFVARNERIVVCSEGGIHAAQAWYLLGRSGFRRCTCCSGAGGVEGRGSLPAGSVRHGGAPRPRGAPGAPQSQNSSAVVPKRPAALLQLRRRRCPSCLPPPRLCRPALPEANPRRRRKAADVFPRMAWRAGIEMTALSFRARDATAFIVRGGPPIPELRLYWLHSMSSIFHVLPVRTIACTILALVLAPATFAQLGARSAEEWVRMLDSKNRVMKLQVDAAVAALQLAPGSVVADIGAGSGVFTLPLAKAVGPGGMINAVDEQGLVDHIMKKVKEEKVTQVTGVLGQFTDPALPARNVDVAFIYDVLHHIEDRVGYLKNLAPYLSHRPYRRDRLYRAWTAQERPHPPGDQEPVRGLDGIDRLQARRRTQALRRQVVRRIRPPLRGCPGAVRCRRDRRPRRR